VLNGRETVVGRPTHGRSCVAATGRSRNRARTYNVHDSRPRRRRDEGIFTITSMITRCCSVVSSE
jgi:hypothetical protein